jgi:ATP-binding cassette subfamily B protein
MSDGERRPGITRSSLRQLAGLLAAHNRALGVGFSALVAVDLIQLAIPRITQIAVDRLAGGAATVAGLWLLGGALVAISVAMGLCRFVWRYFIIGTSLRIERDLRRDFYAHLQTLSPQFFDRTKIGDLMAHSTNDISAVRVATGFAAMASLDALVLFVASLSIMFAINPSLTLLTLIPLPLLTFLMLRFGRIIHRRFTAVQEAFSRLTERAQESFSGIRVVKSYGDEDSEERYFAERADDCVRENVRLARASGIFEPMISALATASTAILLAAGGTRVIRGEISLGQFVAFSGYLNLLIWPMLAVGWVFNMLTRGTASLERLRKLLLTEPDVKDGSIRGAPRPALEVRRLSFAYPAAPPEPVPGVPRTAEGGKAEGTEVLREISLALEPGRTLGIFGRTGAGKTTLVEVLMRLYDPPRGTVFVGGSDVRDLPLHELRSLFAYVPQESFLFALTIAENIAFGVDALPAAEVERLGRLVQIDEEIRAFPDGYGTLVGERGVTLSGGQKQRVALARALAVRPKILILDDALSSVDTETEATILDRLRAERGEETRILIAHRTSTLRHADQILVLERGRLVELGTHDELLAREGVYYELHQMQQLEEEARRHSAEPALPAPEER